MNNRPFLFMDHSINHEIIEDESKRKCRQNFPREFRQLPSDGCDWSVIRGVLLERSESNLSSDVRHLFHTIRCTEAKMITDEHIRKIYRSLFEKDRLGYELIELCDQDVLNRLYATVISQAESVCSRLNLMILFNQPEDAGSLLDEYIASFTSEESDSGEIMIEALVNGSTKALSFDLPLLLDDKGSISFTLPDGKLIETPLQLAAQYGRWEMARVLVIHGADPVGGVFHRAMSNAPVPVEISTARGHEELTMDLLPISSSYLRSVKRPFLFQAVDNTDWRMVQVLLESGVFQVSPHCLAEMSRKAFNNCHELLYTAERSRERALLSRSLSTFYDGVMDSNLQSRQKLFIAMKAVEMVRVISSTDYPDAFKRAVINGFSTSVGAMLPRQSELSKLLVMVVSVALGLVLGATVGSALGAGFVGVLATGSLCGAGTALFAQKILIKKDSVEEVQRAAHRILHS